MKFIRLLFLVCFFQLVFIFNYHYAYAQENIRANEAINYIGQTKTVCGVIASFKYAQYKRGQPTFINLDKPYPNQIFTVIIWGSNRANFNNLDTFLFKGKRICVNGLIKSYHGKPEMVIREPSQIKD